MTLIEKVDMDLRDYAKRLKEANLRTWTGNNPSINYLLFADAKNIGFVDRSKMGYRFFSKHETSIEFGRGFQVSESRQFSMPKLTLDDAFYTLRFYDNGEAERRFNFTGECISSPDSYIRSQGCLLKEI